MENEISSKTFGQRLTAAMAARRVGAVQLARDATVTRWTVNNWRADRTTNPDLDKLGRVAHALGVRPDDLLGIKRSADDDIDTPEKFLLWKAQQQYQETMHLQRVIEAEVKRRLEAAPSRERGRPRKELIEQ